jgi:hypothetical protein
MERTQRKGAPMRGNGSRTVWELFDEGWESIEDIEWPDSTLDVDDDEFARAIAEGRDEEYDAA